MFYPVIKVLQYEGWTTLSNYSPNNWENKDKGEKTIYIIWTDGNRWHSKKLSKLPFGKNFTISTKDLNDEILQNNLAFLYPSTVELPKLMDKLPSEKNWITHLPVWRASVGVKSETAQVSYQGEIEPFPEKASLLTFHPFLQYERDFENYLITINLQSTPGINPSEIEIYKSSGKQYIDSQVIKRNTATIIPLNEYKFAPNELPVFVNREISAIPFGFGCSKYGEMLSLEHTHPPASLVVHGNRMSVQSGIKASWFRELKIK